MDEYNSALESFREKNKDCIVKQLEYGEYICKPMRICMHALSCVVSWKPYRSKAPTGEYTLKNPGFPVVY